MVRILIAGAFFILGFHYVHATACPETESCTMSDTVQPTVLSITPRAGVSNQPIVIDILFSEPVTGFDLTDVIFVGTAAVPLLESLSGSGASYSVRMTGPEGFFRISIAPGSVSDTSGNVIGTTELEATVLLDQTPPTVTVSSGPIHGTITTTEEHFEFSTPGEDAPLYFECAFVAGSVLPAIPAYSLCGPDMEGGLSGTFEPQLSIPGTYTFAVRGSDQNNNISIPSIDFGSIVTFMWTPPSISVIPEAPPTVVPSSGGGGNGPVTVITTTSESASPLITMVASAPQPGNGGRVLIGQNSITPGGSSQDAPQFAVVPVEAPSGAGASAGGITLVDEKKPVTKTAKPVKKKIVFLKQNTTSSSNTKKRVMPTIPHSPAPVPPTTQSASAADGSGSLWKLLKGLFGY